MSTVENADYLMSDNTYNKVKRNTNDIINRNTMHDIQARYSWINAEGTAFLTTLSTSIDNNPRDFRKTDVAYSDGRNTSETIDNSEKTISPLLDLYFKTQLGKSQSLIANATGLYTHTDYAYLFTSDDTFFWLQHTRKGLVAQVGGDIRKPHEALHPLSWTSLCPEIYRQRLFGRCQSRVANTFKQHLCLLTNTRLIGENRIYDWTRA